MQVYFLISNFGMISILVGVAAIITFMLVGLARTSEKDEEKKRKAKHPASSPDHLPHY